MTKPSARNKLFLIRKTIENLYVDGLVNIICWEEVLEHTKSNILDQNSVIVNLYYVLGNEINLFFK